MELSADTAYQIVRVLFAASLLGFLYLVIRTTLKELQQPEPLPVRSRTVQSRAELLTMPGEAGSLVQEGLVFEIQGVSTVGRAQTAHVRLDDVSVSAQHALIRPDDGQWMIEDLGSRNGTLVNGRRVDRPTELSCGDEVQLGRVRLRLMC